MGVVFQLPWSIYWSPRQPPPLRFVKNLCRMTLRTEVLDDVGNVLSLLDAVCTARVRRLSQILITAEGCQPFDESTKFGAAINVFRHADDELSVSATKHFAGPVFLYARVTSCVSINVF